MPSLTLPSIGSADNPLVHHHHHPPVISITLSHPQSVIDILNHPQFLQPVLAAITENSSNMDTSSDHVPVYELALEEEKETFLGMLEENSTPLDKFLFKDPDVYTLLLEGAESSDGESEISQATDGWNVILGVFLLFPNLLSTSDLELTRGALEAMHTLLPGYPEHTNYVYHTKMLDLVKSSLLENDVDLQELKNEVQTFLNARVIPILPPCTITFVD
ncbi:unnamed protein product [Angiostrongylus costaricensis]|uniref:NR LBD domain-containing protein n=1 Tax=Angiostrongylus costaricensis TaxID=334426 RepID=A0A0R3PEN6_ANGCS|nr:unnamed protein product [Angiostrongylus costaricensis]